MTDPPLSFQNGGIPLFGIIFLSSDRQRGGRGDFVPNLLMEILKELGLPHGFEKFDCLSHNASRLLIDRKAREFFSLKQKVHSSSIS